MMTYFSRATLFMFLLFYFFKGATFIQGQEKSYTQTLYGSEKEVEMVFIEEGEFQMGSPDSEWGHDVDESPVNTIKVSAFWMSDSEITWNLYNEFVRRELDALTADPNKGNEVQLQIDAVTGATTPYVDMSFGMGVDGYPAICMTQLAATRFCQWLSALTGNFYRLPTEAEWEYACRAGNSAAYSFGNDLSQLSDYAWFNGNSEGKTQQVKLKKPNSWGLYDMHGNVAEWTLDQYSKEGYDFDQKELVNPVTIETKTYPKSVRGGSWMDDPGALRSASRMGSSKKWKMRDPQIPKSLWWHTDAPFVGFRIVRPLKTPTEEEQKLYWNQHIN